LESVGYYESKVPGLGGAFIEEFEALAELIGDSPEAWQVKLEPDIRRVPLYRFPLSIVYRKKPSCFQILAVANHRSLGNKRSVIDLTQESGMIMSYFYCVRSSSYEHAPENHHAD
jgi:hypothetical protein